MKNNIKAFILAVLALTSVSCSTGAGDGDDSGNETKAKYTITFDINKPNENGSYWYAASEREAPASVTKEEGSYAELPDFSCTLSEYCNGDSSYIKESSFDSWNTDKYGEGEEYKAGSSIQVTKDITLYAIYKETEDDGNDGGNDDALDFSKTTSYTVNVGERLTLTDYIEESEVYYEVQDGKDIVSVSGTTLSADCIGTAIVKATDFYDETKSWYCTVTVKSESFSGNTIEYKLIGTWWDDDSYITFNSDFTGYMKVYLNGGVVQDVSFNWNAYKTSKDMRLEISNANDYLNKEYILESISKTSFKLNGYLAFGKAQVTSWSKE